MMEFLLALCPPIASSLKLNLMDLEMANDFDQVRLFKISLKSALGRIKVQKEDNLSITGLISEYFVSSKMIEKLARETLGRMIDEAPEKLYEKRNESVNRSSVYHATALRKQH